MYLRNGVMKFLKVKNVLLFIAGIFFLFAGSYLIADLMITYRNDIDTALHAKSMPGAIDWAIMGTVFILIVFLSRKLMGDARFYSSYFEGSLYGRISFRDLAKASGKPVFFVALELFFFRFLYMKKYSFVSDEGRNVIELFSKKTLCECKNCGAPVEKKDYFAGTCNFCGSSDVFAKVLAGDRFYSISSDVKKGHNRPTYYEGKGLGSKKTLFSVLLVVGLGVIAICGFMIADSLSNYNNKEYIRKQILDSSNHVLSVDAVHADLIKLILFASVLIAVLIILSVRRLYKIFFVSEAESCAIFFSKNEHPFIPAEEIPSIKAKGNGKMRRVRGALKNGYLANCTMEVHDGQMDVALAKKIVKDTCPSCASPINGAVDEDYVCKVCGNKIMGVLEKK